MAISLVGSEDQWESRRGVGVMGGGRDILSYPVMVESVLNNQCL